MGTVMGYVAEGFEPRYGIFSVPLVWESYTHYQRFFRTDAWKKVVDDQRGRGIEFGWTSPYYMWWAFKDKEVKTLEDMAGIKIRTMESPIQVKAMELLGMKPVAVQTSELTMAMQTGMVDATIMALDRSYMKYLGYLDYMNYAIDYPAQYTANGYGFNAKMWEKLPKDVKDAYYVLLDDFLTERHEVDTAGKALARQFVCDTAKGVVVPEKAEVDRWIKAMDPLLDELAGTVGQDLIDAILDTRAK